MNSIPTGTRSKTPAPSTLITFLKGLMSGLILGVALCAGVALYVTRLPMPFVAHVAPPAISEHAAGDGRDSNAEHGLMSPTTEGSAPASTAPAANGSTLSPTAPAAAPLPIPDSEHTPATDSPSPAVSKPADAPSGAKPLIEHTPATTGTSKNKNAAAPAASNEELASSTAPWFVQTGAFGSASDAENQRAHLALLGLEATVLAPEAGEKPLYRVRLGPLTTIDEVRTLVATLKNNGIPTSISHGNSLKAR